MRQVRLGQQWLWIMLCCLIGLSACQNRSDALSKVCIDGSCVNVDVVSSQPERQRGLQFRQSMPKDEGMLFVFDGMQVHRFWMKDTLIPLDMIWLDERQMIIHIEEHVPPCESDPCPVYGPDTNSLYVLEVNAGVSQVRGWQIGQRADFQIQ